MSSKKQAVYLAVVGLLVCGFATVAVLGLSTQDAKISIEFESLPTIECGEKWTFIGVIRNVGGRELAVSKVRGACDCGPALVNTPARLKPGALIRFPVPFDARASLPGKHSVPITVEFVDRGSRHLHHSMLGVCVDSKSRIAPTSIDFGKLRAGEAAKKELVIRAPHNLDVKGVDAHSEIGWLACNASVRKTDDDQFVDITIEGVADLSEGSISGRINVDVYFETGEILIANVPVFGTIVGPVVVEKKEQCLSFHNVDEWLNPNIEIQSVGVPEITQVECSDPSIQFFYGDVFGMEGGRRYAFPLSFRAQPAFELPATIKFSICGYVGREPFAPSESYTVIRDIESHWTTVGKAHVSGGYPQHFNSSAEE